MSQDLLLRLQWFWGEVNWVAPPFFPQEFSPSIEKFFYLQIKALYWFPEILLRKLETQTSN